MKIFIIIGHLLNLIFLYFSDIEHVVENILGKRKLFLLFIIPYFGFFIVLIANIGRFINIDLFCLIEKIKGVKK